MRLSLYSPCKPFAINQHFAANQPCVRNFGEPNQQVIDSYQDGTCPAGSDKLYPHFGMAGHNGTDLKAGEQEVRAATSGTVVEIQKALARGLGVGILTDEKVEVDGYGSHYIKLRYWHLKTILVQAGQKVSEGDLIGISDNTGYSSGNHVHFEGQPMTKDAGGHPSVVYLPGNIAGAINIEPHFNGKYAADVAKHISLLKQLVLTLQKLIAAYNNK